MDLIGKTLGRRGGCDASERREKSGSGIDF